ncbi:MAG: hypothetical protein ACI4V1_10175 [Eubacteriales bacterium]
MSGKIYYYQNFDINVNDGSLEILLWSIYAGILLGVLGALLYRVYTGSFITAMVSAGALDEQNAVTLDSLKFRGKWYVKRQIASGSSLGRMLICTNADTFPPKKCGTLRRLWHEKFLGTEVPTPVPFDTAKFYLPEERRVSAELRFTTERHPVRTFLLAAVILFLVVLAATYVIPELLQMLDNFLTQVTPEGNII